MSAPGFDPIFIAGPTAVGKSALAVALAERLNGEIISVDSMQVYQGLDIGTAKPDRDERLRVPHHLIDVVPLTETFDAARFVQLARVAVAEIQSRGRLPIFCGGTGLYFKAYSEGLGGTPPADPALRTELETTPLEVLLEFLEQHDPATFERIDRQNPRRIIRAVEVIRLTNRPFSEQRSAWRAGAEETVAGVAGSVAASRCFGLQRPVEDLRRRIDLRVDAMFAHGLVAETQRLMDCGLAQNRTAMQALGYRQVVDYLQNKQTLPEAVEWVKIRTRQFAKRQMTWFRRQMALTWVASADERSPEALADRLIHDFLCSGTKNA